MTTDSSDVEPVTRQALVAALVCEVVYSTEFERTLTAPQLESLQRHYRARCSQIIERFEGHIMGFVSNQIVAAFRVDSRPDVDVSRVLQAGIALREESSAFVEHARTMRAGLPTDCLAVKIGADAGRVDSRRENSSPANVSIDFVTNKAAKCLESAGPNEVVAGQALLDCVPGIFTVRDIETSETGARPTGAIVQRLSGVRSEYHVPDSRSITPFVARDAESTLLFDRWRRTCAGEGRVVLLRGEAGIGKSRLIASLREKLDTTRYSWIECHCSRELQSSAFQPIATLFERTIGFQRSDDPSQQLAELETALRGADFPIDETIPLFATLLGIELSEEYPAIRIGREELRRRTLDWLSEWVVRIAEQQPTIVVADDLHWSDPSTLEFITRLIDLIRERSLDILLLLAAREEFNPHWDGVEQIELPRFSAAETAMMAEAVASGRALSSVLTREVAVRSEGVPLFIEEFTEDILETEAKSGPGPATIETSMLRRIARVSNPEIAQLASVVGHRSTRPILEAIATGRSTEEVEIEIDKLLSAGILSRRFDESGDIYRFRHALVRDALYDDLTEECRRDYHERVAVALEGLGPDRAGTRPETIALHFKLAGEPHRALAYYETAAQLAAKISAHAEAIEHFQEALALLASGEANSPSDAKKELELLVTLGPSLIATHGYGDPQVADVYARAHSLCERINDPALIFRALYGLSVYFQARGSRVHSGELAEKCLELAEQIGDPAFKVLSHQRIGLSLLYGGMPEQALSHLEKAISYYDPALHRPLAFAYGGDMGVHSRAYAAMTSFIIGRPDRARLYARAALADAREGGHQHTIGFALSFCGIVYHMLGDRARVLELSEEGVDEADRYGFALWSGISHVLRGSALASVDSTRAGANEEIRQALDGLDRIGSVVGTSFFYATYATSQLASGSEQGALDSLTASLDFAEASQSPFWNVETLRVEGEILARRGQNEEARASFEAAVETARSQGARALELRAASSLERLLRGDGRTVEANALIGLAWERFASGFDNLDLATTRDILTLSQADLDAAFDTTFDTEKALENLISRLPRDATHVESLRQLLRRPDPRPAKPGAGTRSTTYDLVSALTPRRLQVLRLVTKGLTNREIAGVLKISEHTAKAHVAGLLEALDLSNRTEAAVALSEFESE